LCAAIVIGLLGLAGVSWCVLSWASKGFGPLEYASMLRMLAVSLTAIAAALQLAFTAFLAGIMEIPAR
jgi:hypothetical protein